MCDAGELMLRLTGGSQQVSELMGAPRNRRDADKSSTQQRPSRTTKAQMGWTRSLEVVPKERQTSAFIKTPLVEEGREEDREGESGEPGNTLPGEGGCFHAPLTEEGTKGPSNTSKLGNLEMPEKNGKLNGFGARKQDGRRGRTRLRKRSDQPDLRYWELPVPVRTGRR